MPNSIGPSGLTVATQAELLAGFDADYETIYGADINLSSDTPDGQQINIFIQAVLDLEDLLVQINNMFDPDNAVGVILDQRCAINGVQRQQGTFTITNITIVTNQNANFFGLDQSEQAVYTVADNAGNQWQLVTTQLGISPGTNVFVFQAAAPGANLTVPNTITVPVSVVLGVTSINNPTPATTVGTNEESDAALKIRRQKSVGFPSQGYFRSLYAALSNINGITSVELFENRTGAPDGNSIDPAYPLGTPGHCIWVIVAGSPSTPLSPAWSSTTTYAYGAVASSAGINYISWKNSNLNNAVTDAASWGVYNPVAQAIYTKRNAGADMRGETSYTVTQIDGSPFVVQWDVVTQETLFAAFTVTSLNGTTPPNIAAIRAGLAQLYGVNQEVNINMLATKVQSVDPNTLVTFTSSGTPMNGGFSTSSLGTYTFTLVPSLKSKQFSLTTPNIIILPMQLSPYNPLTGAALQIAASANQQLTGLGGFGALVYSFVTNASGGSIGSSTGLYTAGTTSGVNDIILVTDSLGNTAQAVIAVI